MRRLLAVAMLSIGTPVAAQIPERFENLQVLPREIRRDSLVSVMREFASALGVRCVHCHVGEDNPTLAGIDFKSDDRAPKRLAREMMRLVRTVNDELLAGLRAPGEPGTRVSCITCHRGMPRPVVLEDTLQRVLERAGADSAVAEYRRLRGQHFGRGRFDFGIGALNTLGERLLARDRYAEARVLAVLNVELFPDRWEAAYTLGRALEGLADTTAAVAQYRRVLEAVPSHGPARQRLDRLTRRPP